MALWDNLVARWKLTDGALLVDDSGSGLDLTNVGTVTNTTGFIGSGNTAALFNGSSQSLTHADNSLLRFQGNWTIAGRFTVAAAAGAPSGIQEILVDRILNNSTGYSLEILMAFGRLKAQMSSNGTTLTNAFSSGFTVTANDTWYNWSLRYDGTNLTAAINGVNGTPVAFAGCFDVACDFHIGKRYNSTLYWNGKQDDIAYWSRTLSDAELTTFFALSPDFGEYAVVVDCTVATATASGFDAQVIIPQIITCTVATADASGFDVTIGGAPLVVDCTVAEASAFGYLALGGSARTNTVISACSNAGYSPFGEIHQNNVHMTGDGFRAFLHTYLAGSSDNVKRFVAELDGAFGTGETCSGTLVTQGYMIASAFSQYNYAYCNLWAGSSNKEIGWIRNTGLLTSSDSGGFFAGLAGGTGLFSSARDYTWCDMIVSSDQTLWRSATANSGTEIKVQIGSQINNETWGTVTTLFSSLSGGARSKLVTFQDNAIGIIVTETNKTISYKHYDPVAGTWGSTETISAAGASLGEVNFFSAAVTYDDRLVVAWLEAGFTLGSSTIKYRVRTAGTWGSVGTLVTGVYNYACVLSANLGSADEIFVIYENADNEIIVYSMTDCDATTLTHETTLVTNAVKTAYIQAPISGLKYFCVAYQESASPYNVKLATWDKEPVALGVSGTYVSSMGRSPSSTAGMVNQLAMFGEYSFLLWDGNDGGAWANVLIKSTGAKQFADTRISPYTYFDVHNLSTVSISPTGYIHVGMAGRTSDALIIYRSLYPLGDASFTLDPAGWEDITPTPPSGVTRARGYKYLVIDDSEVLHLIHMYSDAGWINNYDPALGTWTTWVKIFDFDSTVATYPNVAYCEGALLGKETSGQKSINIACGWDLPYGYGGMGMSYYHYFFRLLPQTGRTYLAEDIAGTSITLPLTDAYTSGDAIFFDGSVETTLRSMHWNGFFMKADNMPMMANKMFLVSTGMPDHIRINEWVSGAWRKTTAENTLYKDALGNNFSLDCYEDSATGYQYVVFNNPTALWGYGQLYQAESTDGGATWGTPTQRTFESKSALNPISDQTMIYSFSNTHLASEVRFLPRDAIQLILAGAMSMLGSAVKQTSKYGSGVVSTIGSAARLPNKSLSGVLNSAGGVARSVLLSVVGALSLAGHAYKAFVVSASGALSFAGAASRQVGKQIAGTVSTAGAMSRSIAKRIVGTLTSSGTIIKTMARSVSGALSMSGALASVRAVLLAIGGALSFAGGSVRRSVGKSLSGAVTFGGTINRAIIRSVVGTVGIAGSLRKQVNTGVSGSLSFLGDVATSIIVTGTQYFQAIGGALNLSGALSKLTSKTVGGVLTVIGRLYKSIAKSVSGPLSVAGGVYKRVSKEFTGSLSLSGIVSTVRFIITQVLAHLKRTMTVAAAENLFVVKATEKRIENVDAVVSQTVVSEDRVEKIAVSDKESRICE